MGLMGRTVAGLAAGRRITDFIGLGVIAKTFPIGKVHEVLAASGKTSIRQRDLPAHVVVYYVIALALFMNASCKEVLRCMLEGVQWLSGPGAALKVAGKSGISQARTRLGFEAVQRLHDAMVQPIATRGTKGAWFGAWRLVSLDGSTFDVADDPALEAAFGRPGAGHGESAFPQVRFVSLVENGTHVLFGTKMAGCTTSEIALTKEVLPALRQGMLCLADRNFFGYAMWTQASATGADLLWRIKQNARLKDEQRLPDGSYLSHIYPSETDRRRKTKGVAVRVIDYRLDGVEGAEPIYRLATTVLDHAKAGAEDLAALYHERWEIETALGELKTHLRGAKIVLRSKTPDLVRQEVFGLLMAHFAIRGLMHEAALQADEDPDRLSFLHAVRVIRRKLPAFGAIPPSASSRPA
ncbi:IS4 family transposase [Pararhizobium sp. LjRoot235]|uniref:IS4 family transposase n=1 Tax=Pararhizobium sp. LjRoot235 TaxID=3342291 RepID=UPI003F506BB2